MLSATLDPDADGLLESLPADVTLVGGGDLAAALDSPLGRALSDVTGEDSASFQARALDLGVGGITRVVAGCGGDGCVATGPGTLLASRFSRSAEALGMLTRNESGRTIVESGGVPFALTAAGRTGDDAGLMGGSLLAGDLPAVVAFGSTRLGAGAFDDLVPEGHLWLAARDPETLLSQAADRLEAEGSESGATLAGRLRDGEDTAAFDQVVAMGMSIGTGDPATVRLRVRCVDTLAARKVALVMDAALLEQRLLALGASEQGGDLSGLLDDVEIVRVDDVVEARVTAPAATVAAALAGGAR